MKNIENQIKLKFYNYCIEKKISIFNSPGYYGIYLTEEAVHHFSQPFYNLCDFNTFSNSKLENIRIHTINKDKSTLYFNLFNTLNLEEKQFFLENFFLKYHADLFYKNPFIFSDNDYWLHFSSINKKTYYSPSESIVKSIFKTIENKSIDSEFKVKSLLNFVNYYSNHFKSSQLNTNLIKILNLKVSESYYPNFEKIIKTPIKKDNESNFIQKNNQIITFFIDINSLLMNVSLKDNQIANSSDYNNFLTISIKTFLESKHKDDLGITYIDIIKSSKLSSNFKMFIEMKKDNNLDLLALFKDLFVYLSNYKKEDIKVKHVNLFLDQYLLNIELNYNRKKTSGFKI